MHSLSPPEGFRERSVSDLVSNDCGLTHELDDIRFHRFPNTG